MMLKRIKKPQELTADSGIPANAGSYAARAREHLGRVVVSTEERTYMDIGDPLLNQFIGDKQYGVFNGLMIELRSESSGGKSGIAAHIGGMMLRRGAYVHWLDVETSWANRWMEQRGLPREYVNLYQPYRGLFDGMALGHNKTLTTTEAVKMLRSDPRRAGVLAELPSAESLLEEVETGVKLAYLDNPQAFQYVVVDSVAALLPDEVLQAGATGGNMRTKLSLASLMSSVLPRWLSLMAQYRAVVLLLNQVRMSPGGFGDPRYSPGGKAIGFYPQVRLEIARKSGFVQHNGVVVGIGGTIKTKKQKAGGVEGLEISYQLPFNSNPIKFKALEKKEKK